jgi:hypothetical protein
MDVDGIDGADELLKETREDVLLVAPGEALRQSCCWPAPKRSSERCRSCADSLTVSTV